MAPQLEVDERWKPRNGPVLERVMRCSVCKALVVEEWHSRTGHGEADREVRQVHGIDEVGIAQRFERVT